MVKFRANPPPSRSSSSCTRRSPAVPGHPVWVSRGGHRSGSCRTPWSSLPTSCPWFRSFDLPVVLGGSGDGGAAQARRAVCRAGYRSARDLCGLGLPAFCRSSSADGRKVGGSADGTWIRICSCCCESPGVEGSSGHWPSSCSLPLQFLRVGGEAVEVFKILEQDRVLQQRL